MSLSIRAQLDYWFELPTDVLLQFEAAAIPEQVVEATHLDITATEHFARVVSHDGIGERIWVRVEGQLLIDYRATVRIERLLDDCQRLPVIAPHQLPGETVQYLMASRYCPSDQFECFVEAEFGKVSDGAKVIAMRDWIASHVSYVQGASNSETTALDTFVKRQGICRDYAHVMITFARAAGIPARIASVYALGVEPPDFHAVAEVFLGGAWHLIDATGMAEAHAMAKIGIGRDAADVAFLTAFGTAEMKRQNVSVTDA
ncbi:transglutaminase family protein [Sphingomonas sp. R647]|uniref:transglutaminase-like domain-containing protein n=1 Tax=Sphingomonas sp. R647 TaxID=2875233 RepID=UPI001CD634E2|nr:transglutaminase family protein [Sphingomonas sp. R647]MCA1196384.1 transglutaminase family protein [Sphingomonas sp. R647]